MADSQYLAQKRRQRLRRHVTQIARLAVALSVERQAWHEHRMAVSREFVGELMKLMWTRALEKNYQAWGGYFRTERRNTFMDYFTSA